MQLRESYAVTLHAYLQLEDERRLEQLLQEGDRLSLGGLVAVAFNQPEKLKGLSARYLAKVKGKISREDAFKRAAQILKREAKAMQRKPKKPRAR